MRNTFGKGTHVTAGRDGRFGRFRTQEEESINRRNSREFLEWRKLFFVEPTLRNSSI